MNIVFIFIIKPSILYTWVGYVSSMKTITKMIDLKNIISTNLFINMY